MGVETGYDSYSRIVVIVFGILGNVLVIISVLRQKNVLKNNYYFLVLQLAICDLGVLIIYLFDDISWVLLDEPLFDYYKNKFYCVGYNLSYIFQVAGIGMMLVISVLRYRATVHPLKTAITRRKLKVVCGLVYVVGLIAGYGPFVPVCLLKGEFYFVYDKFTSGYIIFCYYFFPTIFMAVVYFEIGRALIKQNKYIKSVCSNPVKRSAPSSSFNIVRFIRNRKTFFVCLSTVLCYGVGNIPYTVYYIWEIAEEYGLMMKYVWIFNLAAVVRVAGSHSVNPLLYGILDKKLFQFWKICRKKNWAGITGKLNSCCIKLKNQDLDWWTRIWKIVIHLGCDYSETENNLRALRDCILPPAN